MTTFLYRLGAFGARWRWSVVTGWLLVLSAAVTLGILFAGTFQSSSSIPGSPAQSALTAMDRHFPSPNVQSAEIVYRAPAGRKLTDPGLRTSLDSSLAALGRVGGVMSVTGPAQDGLVSGDGRTEVAQVDFTTTLNDDVPAATLDAVRATGTAIQREGVEVVYGGDAFDPTASAVGPTELIGVLMALAVLVITFGSLLAAGLPLLTALFGVLGTLTGLAALSSVVGISNNAPTLAAMLGLAVGIDYALFIVSRHRGQLAVGVPLRESIARATAGAGSAVVFAGATVVIALAGLSVAGVPVLTSMGLASAGAVALAVLMALSLLPALLSIAGRRLIPKPGSRATRRAVRTDKPTMGVRWVAMVTRHPVRSLVAVVVGLLVISAPALHLKLALTDDGSNATTTSTRQAYDLIGQAFGPGADGPLLILVENGDPATVASTATTVVQALHRVPGIAQVSGVDTAKDDSAARIQIIPATGPRTPQTSGLVNRLRAMSAPIARSTGSYVAVTGLTAVSIDVSAKLSSALLPFVTVVVGLSLVLLMVAFRSIAIPIKAAAGFLLSVGSAFGATVAVFQWGWLSRLLGVPSLGPVNSVVPIIVMAVLFGLAMDYEVFLVSSIREDYLRGNDARAAILAGARSASRVVTSAALIMVSVFISFLFSRDPIIMPIAFALAFGVVVDAFLVRMTLVPAVLTLLGDRAWWLPRRLERIVPRLDLEGGDAGRTTRTPLTTRTPRPIQTPDGEGTGAAADGELLDERVSEVVPQ